MLFTISYHYNMNFFTMNRSNLSWTDYIPLGTCELQRIINPEMQYFSWIVRLGDRNLQRTYSWQCLLCHLLPNSNLRVARMFCFFIASIVKVHHSIIFVTLWPCFLPGTRSHKVSFDPCMTSHFLLLVLESKAEHHDENLSPSRCAMSCNGSNLIDSKMKWN